MTKKRKLVVVGNGMAGARFVEEVLTIGGRDAFEIVMFGNELHGNYNRILLSGVLSGERKPDDIFINSLPWYEENKIRLHVGVKAEHIFRRVKMVVGTGGVVEDYDHLVIATGSSPFIPRMEGLYGEKRGFRDGVFVFRTLDDCDSIMKYAAKAPKVAVIGGGLLGLEAARGLLNLGAEVHVVHLMPHLMETQLDPPAGAILKRTLEKMGVRIHLEKATTAILGNGRVTGLAFNDGSKLDCDMVVISAGIRPNVEVARQAGLPVERGIVVNDDLASPADPNIFAVGECAQHRGKVYGLVAPLWEQAKILAERIARSNKQAFYQGSSVSTKLKVMGVQLAVMGEKESRGEDDEVVTYTEPTRGIYKKMIVRDGRIVGAIVLGEDGPFPSLLQAFDRGAEIRENRSEVLFPQVGQAQPLGTDELPDSAQICNCNSVSKGEILSAIQAGNRTLEAISGATRACTGCGSCELQVQAILQAACAGDVPSMSILAGAVKTDTDNTGKRTVQSSTTKIEQIKQEKDGLDVAHDLPRFAQEGWTSIPDADKDRLKWLGVFFRRQTPGHFMMRVRIPNGISNAAQLRAMAEVSREFGSDFVDITTRQQIQLRGFEIGHVEKMWKRLEEVGLGSLQTGMDNIRNVVGCPVAGLTANELIDASPVVDQYTRMFVGNKAYTNLPRKFNVSVTGCRENCTHADSQDIAMTPAIQEIGGKEIPGFNVAVGGKMGSGGYRSAIPLNAFVTVEDAAAVCSEITLIFRDYGPREARSKARLAFLIDSWGIEKFRAELMRRIGRDLPPAGQDMRHATTTDHLGIIRQKQAGLNYLGLTVPVGRIKTQQLSELATLAERYGNGEVRITTDQNLILPNVPDNKLLALTKEPLLQELKLDPSEYVKGLVSCTGMDYCHMALIETKHLAMKAAGHLERQLGQGRPITMRWSGCPASCGNHLAADIGLVGKNIKVNGKVVDAVDIFVGGKSGPNSKSASKLMGDVHCDELPEVLERLVPLVPYLSESNQRDSKNRLTSALQLGGSGVAVESAGMSSATK